MRIKESLSGGGGPSPSDEKSPDNLFFSSPQFLLHRGSNSLFQRKIFQVPGGERRGEGVQHFARGEGIQLLIPIETYRTFDFPGGGGGGGGRGVWTS